MQALMPFLMVIVYQDQYQVLDWKVKIDTHPILDWMIDSMCVCVREREISTLLECNCLEKEGH